VFGVVLRGAGVRRLAAGLQGHDVSRLDAFSLILAPCCPAARMAR
jgi:hypothetical protein